MSNHMLISACIPYTEYVEFKKAPDKEKIGKSFLGESQQVPADWCLQNCRRNFNCLQWFLYPLYYDSKRYV